MEIVMFKDTEEEEIRPDHPREVDLDEALFHINNSKADFDSVIGFQSSWNGLCFLRNGIEMWKVMLLYKENNLGDWDSSDRDFSTTEVVAIVEAFFADDSKWEKLCGVHRLSLARKIWFNALALYHSRKFRSEVG